jgi:hypothetical protein
MEKGGTMASSTAITFFIGCRPGKQLHAGKLPDHHATVNMKRNVHSPGSTMLLQAIGRFRPTQIRSTQIRLRASIQWHTGTGQMAGPGDSRDTHLAEASTA